ncbi:hypothetical protein DL93DRAFT_2167965 [Clavulina sp. PMI_390]|nr:hypothetical protein DL93DRAFT_2167965 [Clavulina sp. PMI_390]
MKIPIDEYLASSWASIEIPDDSVALPEAKVENVVPLASYTWVGRDERTPRMLVPSCPSLYSQPSLPFRSHIPAAITLGFVPGNQDLFRSQQSPLIPLVESVRFLNPSFDFSMIDIVTNRNNLRKLLEWIQGSKDEFRINIQRAGNGTVLFTRWEDQVSMRAAAGYGFEFKKDMTDPSDRRPPDHHHRTIAYDFAGLRMLVRSKIDAYMTDEDEESVRNLASIMGSLSLDQSSSLPPTPDHDFVTSSGIEISPSSTFIPQSQIVEFASRLSKAKGEFNWAKKYPQVYLSAIPTFMIGYHNDGIFHSVEKFDVTDAGVDKGPEVIRQARNKTLPSLNKLGEVLNIIRDTVLELTDDDESGPRRHRLFALVHRNRELRLYERAGGTKLPDDLLELF